MNVSTFKKAIKGFFVFIKELVYYLRDKAIRFYQVMKKIHFNEVKLIKELWSKWYQRKREILLNERKVIREMSKEFPLIYNLFRRYRRLLWDLILTYTPITAIVTLIVATGFVIYLSWNKYDGGFLEGVLVESHGMLLDILVIAFFITLLNKLGEKRLENKRYQEEIDDFRGWKSDEAAHRIVGNIKRLNNNGISEINLYNCYLRNQNLQSVNLQGADLTNAKLENANLHFSNLQKAKLQGTSFKDSILEKVDFTGVKIDGKTDFKGANFTNAEIRNAYFLYINFNNAIFITAHLEGTFIGDCNLSGANFHCADLKRVNFIGSKLLRANFWEAKLQGANFDKVDLQRANFQDANLEEAKNLTIKQLCRVKTLFRAKLDKELEEQVKEECPHLLEESSATTPDEIFPIW